MKYSNYNITKSEWATPDVEVVEGFYHNDGIFEELVGVSRGLAQRTFTIIPNPDWESIDFVDAVLQANTDLRYYMDGQKFFIITEDGEATEVEQHLTFVLKPDFTFTK